MNVPLLDLERQYAALKTELDAALLRVASSGRYILGPEVEAFEKEAAAYLSVAHAIGCTSGTDAIWLALKALGVGSGDRVLTSPFTFFATCSAIVNAGAEPVFADIRHETFNIDPARAEDALKADRRIRAMIPVHLYGQPADMPDLLAVASRYGVRVIEDAAQAIGAAIDGRHVGGWGDLGCFSFFPSKNLGCFGDGGLVTTNDPALAEKVRLLRGHGSKTKYRHSSLGGNFRLDTIQAAVLRVKLPRLDGWIQARQRIAHVYDERLNGRFGVPERVGDRNHVFHQYTLRAKNRDALSAALTRNGVGSMVYYPVPCHLQEALAFLGHREGAFPVSERACQEVISIPVFPELTDEEQDQVIRSLLESDCG